ncbi:hypothetical protein ACPOLB_05715 [Rubrivivax sp. RP6-9]|uniref:hypothetical protein n=1 Tax=Rubrivivax sp. RP6-9 TaxID=3415750 RepID=UPI003CC5209F
MATDWLVYWMTRPEGLALIALAVAVPFAIWRMILGPRFVSVGFAPLATGYALAGVGLALTTLISSHVEFTSRVSTGALVESDRWSIVPGWSFYFVVLSLILVLPLLGLIGTPASAWLLRKRCLSHRSIAGALVGVWLVVAALAWLTPSNEWHRTHKLESLGMWLSTVGASVVAVGLPFVYGIYLVARRRERSEA